MTMYVHAATVQVTPQNSLMQSAVVGQKKCFINFSLVGLRKKGSKMRKRKS